MGSQMSAAKILLTHGTISPTAFSKTFAFSTGDNGWYPNNAWTTFSTDRFVSSTDLLAVRLDWSGAITLTGLSFQYQSGWTNGASGTIGFRDQTDTLLQSETGVSAATQWTGLSHPGMTSLYIGWNFFPNTWLTAYSLISVTMTYSGYANPFA